MKRLLKKALSLNFLIKMFGWEIFNQAIKAKIKLEILADPQDLLLPSKEPQKILILSPHPDDDVFGLGGVISKYTKAQDIVKVIYLCDGSKGNPQGICDSSLADKRKKESQKSAKILGIPQTFFWGYKDGKLSADKTSVNALKTLLESFRPDIIYTPGLMDDHLDHQATNDILYVALFAKKKINYLPKLITMYEVWTPLLPNRIVDISSVLEIKKQAIEAQQSQLTSRGYQKAILALNQYRAEMSGLKGYAEAFLAISPQLYQKLFQLKK